MDDLLLGAGELLPGTEDLPVTLIGGLVAWKRDPCQCSFVKKFVHKMSVKAVIKKLKYKPSVVCVCSTPHTHPTLIESFANVRISFRQGHSDSLNNPLEECKVSVKIVKNLRVWDEPVDRTLELARSSNVHCTPFLRVGWLRTRYYFHLPNQSTPKREAHVQVQDKWMPKRNDRYPISKT